MNRSYKKKDLGKQKEAETEAAAAIQSLDEVSTQEYFAHGSAGDATQNTSHKQKSYQFDRKDSTHLDVFTVGPGGDDPLCASPKQQYTVGSIPTAPLKGILARSGTWKTQPLPKIENYLQYSMPLKQQIDSVVGQEPTCLQKPKANTSALSKSQDPEGEGSLVLATSNDSSPSKKIAEAGPQPKAAVSCFSATSSPLKQSPESTPNQIADGSPKKSPDASNTSALSKSQDAEGEGSLVLANSNDSSPSKKIAEAGPQPKAAVSCFSATSSPLKQSPEVATESTNAAKTCIFDKSQGSVEQGSSVLNSSQKKIYPLSSVLSRPGGSERKSSPKTTPSKENDSPTEDCMKTCVVPGCPTPKRPQSQLIPSIPLKRGPVEVVKPPVRRVAVDRPRLSPQDGWNVHVKSSKKRNNGGKDAQKMKSSAQKNPAKGAGQPANLIQNCIKTAPEATPEKRPIVAEALTAAPKQPNQMIRSEEKKYSPPLAHIVPRTSENKKSIDSKEGSPSKRPSRLPMEYPSKKTAADEPQCPKGPAARDVRLCPKRRSILVACPTCVPPRKAKSKDKRSRKALSKKLDPMKSPLLKRSQTSVSLLSQNEAAGDSSGEERNVQNEDEEKEDEDESVTQHPLNNEWTMWYVQPHRNKTWEETLHRITSFKTVETFWSLYYHIKRPSEINIGCDYCMFKTSIRPMWEDAANVKGGCWIASFPKSATTELNFYWEYSLLSLIGELYDHSPDLCGAVVNIRQNTDKIALWTSDGTNEEGILEIGRQLRYGLPTVDGYVLQYLLNSDRMAQQGSNVKAIYTL
ncbi:nascent polypeptide-associated complex subunit alpha, muscle-specific form isoform X2 [Drosophila guanche]|uniref:nascent polypeptide-associated complex subunit alpha, muscle-specific form isoform X2 n=1 Tax=Drosophila guanche TaxID=7266 RepID=UPI00147228D7|nr:nascent polypeptide-associated complex subunit alpha, muscle-specific form isoform X2 [Drosophila guanche]